MLVRNKSKVILNDQEFNTIASEYIKNANREAQFFHFKQEAICKRVSWQATTFKELNKINTKYNGLCEIICNYIIMEDLLGKTDFPLSQEYNKNSFNLSLVNNNFVLQHNANSQNHLQAKINLFTLNSPKVRQSHILQVSTFFEKFLAYLFNIYPNDIFSINEKAQRNKQVNKPLLINKLSKLEDHTYIKFNVFAKRNFVFEGHSMLIKKTGDTYSFFDPNEGEYTNMDIDALCEKINDGMQKYQATHMAFMHGNKYIEHLKFSETNTTIPALA